MKVKFFFLGLCALALAACSLDEVSQVNDTNAVTFKATTATRVAAVTTNTLNEFSVWAWNGTNEFMDDVIATKSGSSFVTYPLYFWPTGSVDFYALVPSTTVTAWEDVDGVPTEYAYLGGELDPDHELTEDKTPWVYTGNVAKAQISNGKIVIDAYIPSLAEEQIDLCYGVALEKSSGSVPMNFRHALSQVAFKVTNSNPAFVVDIQEISLCSVNKEGTLTITRISTDGNLETPNEGISEDVAKTQGTWVIKDKDDDNQQVKARYVPGITPTVLTGTDDGTVDVTTDPLMILPQDVKGWDVYTDEKDTELGAYIRILCNVQENGSQLWPNTVEENYEPQGDEDHPVHRVGGKEYAEIAVPIKDITWEQGYKYTYTLIFGEGIGYYPPDDPNTELDGTPILVPITFDVTVDEFQNAVATEEGQYDVSTNTDVVVYNEADLIAAWYRGLSPIEIAADITLYQEDLVLSSGATMDIIIDEGCTLYINNIDDGYGYPWDAFYVTDGTLNIYGDGAIKCTLTEEEGGLGFYAVWISDFTGEADAVVNIYGCTIQGYPDCVYAERGYANIYGGTFYGTSTYRDTYWLLNCYDSSYKEGSANIYVYGGTYYEFDPANNVCEGEGTNFCVDGYGTVSYTDDNGTWYEVIKTTVATPADLKAAVEAGASEITVAEDIVIDEMLQVESDLHLVLNADLSMDSFEDGANTGNLYFFHVTNDATLTIDGDGSIISPSENPNDADDWVGCVIVGSYDKSTSSIQSSGHVVINSGSYYGSLWTFDADNYVTGSVATIYVQAGDATLNGGTYYGGLDKGSFNSAGWKVQDTYTEQILNCLDAPREAGDAWIYVNGGKFRNFDPANNATEGANTNYVTTGHTSTQSGPDADGNYWFTVE